MKWGAVHIMISVIVWSLLIGIIVHHVETRPQTRRSRRKSRALIYSQPRAQYDSRRMYARGPIVAPPIIKPAAEVQEFSIDVAQAELWPSWLQEKYKDQIEAKKKAMQPRKTVIRPSVPGKYDQLSELLWGAIDERMYKKEHPCEQSFRAGRSKRRDVTGGVVEDVANVLVNYRNKRIIQEKRAKPVNREFVQELSQFLMDYNNDKQAYVNVEE